MSVYTSNANELCCPLCGDTNTHLDEVAFAVRPLGEDGPIDEFSVTSRGAVLERPGAVPLSRSVGAGRRHRFALLGWCESCQERFALVFTQHRGATLTESVALAPEPAIDWPAA